MCLFTHSHTLHNRDNLTTAQFRGIDKKKIITSVFLSQIVARILQMTIDLVCFHAELHQYLAGNTELIDHFITAAQSTGVLEQTTEGGTVSRRTTNMTRQDEWGSGLSIVPCFPSGWTFY